MRELEALQVDNSDNSQIDPFDEVMKDNHNGRVRLLGRGVSRKKLNEKGPSTSLILLTEVMESIKSVITADVQKDLIAEKEELAKEKEAHAAQVAKLKELEKNIEAQKEKMVIDVVGMVLAQLHQKEGPSLSLTPEVIAKAIASSTNNGVEHQ